MPLPSLAAGPREPPLSDETLGALIDRIARADPGREAVVSVAQNVRLTYAELRDATDAFARGLMGLGVGAGDRVGIWSANTFEWIVAQFATPKIGAILVNVNPAFRAAEARYALAHSGVSVLLAQVRHRGNEYARAIGEIRGDLPALRYVVLIGDDELDAPFEGMRWDDVATFAGAHVSASALAERMAAVCCDDAVNLQYTSGTTGRPKGATLSHRNVLNNGYFVGEGCRYTARDRLCVPVPFYHCFGMVLANLAAITHGATIVIPGPSFDPAQTLRAVEREACTALYGVPTMFIAELALPDFEGYDLRSLRTGIMAGAPCPVDVMERVRGGMHMPEVTICYGMTETSPVSAQTAVDDSLELRTQSVGRVHPHVEVKIVDQSGNVVARGVAGELCTRGYGVMLGYWNDPEQSAAALDAERYLHTGDLATMDEQGYLRIVGRIKDLVIRGGENVYPREIEECLYAHPAVRDVAIIGVPDARYGEELCAWIVVRDGHRCDEESVRTFCRERLAHYKVPRYVSFVDAFPLTVSGKVQKFKMREIAAAELAARTATA